MDTRDILAQTQLFAGLGPAALDELASRAHLREVASGETLIRVGAPAEYLYIVVMGRLRVELPDGSIPNDIGRREPVGEIALISGEPHTSTVYAVRDSLLLAIRQLDLLDFLREHPSALLALSRTIIKRLRQNLRLSRLAQAQRPSTFAVLPAHPGIDARAFAAAFCAAVDHGRSRLLDSTIVAGALGDINPLARSEVSDERTLIAWLHTQEHAWRHLVFLADAECTPWSLRCMRQADRILIVADPRDPPMRSVMIDELARAGLRAPVDLVFTGRDRPGAARVGDWRRTLSTQSHYFWRPGDTRELQRIARSLTGRALGLVLGGGGARGFAHLGLVQALEELDMPVDLIGGSSMGAFFGALMADGCDAREMRYIARQTFVTRNYLNDYLFPNVALIRGRKFVQRLGDIFEDRQIEDLRTPYFCISTNLTRGNAMVHDNGPLATWVAASMAVPGVAPPVAYRGELLADGAVANSLPTDVMQSLARGPIIASDVSTAGALAAPGIEGPDTEGLFRWSQLIGNALQRPNLFSILFRTATLTSESGVAARAAQADLYLRMPVEGIALFDWKRLDELAERGYQHALAQLTAFKAKMAAK